MPLLGGVEINNSVNLPTGSGYLYNDGNNNLSYNPITYSSSIKNGLVSWIEADSASSIIDQVTKEAPIAYGGISPNSNESIIIGAGISGFLPFRGLINSYATWNRTLTPKEISWLYNNGSGRSYSEL